MANFSDLIIDKKTSSVNGVSAAGNSKYYGTDSGGAAGFHDLPAGVGGGDTFNITNAIGGLLPIPNGKQTALGGEGELTVSGLSATKCYRFRAIVKGSQDASVYLYVNGDDTAGNYNSNVQFGSWNNPAPAAANVNATPAVGFAYTTGFAHIMGDSEIDPTSLCWHNYGIGFYVDSGAGDRPARSQFSMMRGPDTTELNSISVKMSSGTFEAGSTLEVYEYNPNYNALASSANGGIALGAVQDATFAAQAFTLYPLNSNGGAFNANLPAGSDGDLLEFVDFAGTDPNVPTGLGLNAVTLVADGTDTIQGAATMVLDQENQGISLIFLSGRWNVRG